MWDFIHEIVRLLTNNTISNGSKWIAALFVIGFILVIDNSLGTSYYYSKYLQLEQLKNILEIKDRYKDDKQISRLLFHEERSVMNRKSLIQNISIEIGELIHNIGDVDSGEPSQKNERGGLHIITSSFFLLL